MFYKNSVIKLIVIILIVIMSTHYISSSFAGISFLATPGIKTFLEQSSNNEILIQKKLREIEGKLDAELKRKKPALSDLCRDKIILISMKPVIKHMISAILKGIGNSEIGEYAFYLVRPMVKWLCKKFIFIADVDVKDNKKYEQEMKKIIRFINKTKEQGMSIVLDNIGDRAVSEEGAEQYSRFYEQIIEYLKSKNIKSDLNISIKLSALVYDFDRIKKYHDPFVIGTEEESVKQKAVEIKERLKKILSAVNSLAGNHVVRIDMEEYKYRDATLALFKEVIEENKEICLMNDTRTLQLGLAIQSYFKDSGKIIHDLYEWAKKHDYRMPVRLVKGAYDVQEKADAVNGGYESPVFMHKDSTDAHYELITRFLIENRDYFHCAFGSHNIRSIAVAIALSEQYGIDKSDIELQMLYGMGDEIKRVLVDMGYEMRIYLPIGTLKGGVKYAGRRFNELANKDNALTRTLKGNYIFLSKKPVFWEDDTPAFMLFRDDSLTFKNNVNLPDYSSTSM